MSDDQWFRSASWDASARADFERGLAAVKPSDRPTEYLRIKGMTLLDSSSPEVVAGGVELLERLIRDFSDSRAAVAGAHQHLAEHYRDAELLDRAIEHFRLSVAAERGCWNREWQSELSLAELLAADPSGRDDDEATVLLDEAIDSGLWSMSPRLQLRYAIARARVERRRGRPDLAAAYAASIVSTLPPTVPEVSDLRAEMVITAQQGDAEAVSPLVAEFRGVDGAVRWTWDLVAQLHVAPEPGSPLPQTSQRRFAACERELREAGFETFALWGWRTKELSTPAEARRAAAILLRWFDETPDRELRTAIARSLCDTRLRKLAASPFWRPTHSFTPRNWPIAKRQ